jgi:hypothetical protein
MARVHVSGAWVASIALVALGVFLGIAAAGSPQCCDADAYWDEAYWSTTGGWSSGWLGPVHNYGYPVFIALLRDIRPVARLGVAIAQLALLYVAAIALALSLARSTRSSFPTAMAWVSAIALLPAAAWSGYYLSEALAAPVLLLMLALGIAACLGPTSGAFRLGAIAALGLVSGFAWMVRPALIWVPAVLGSLVLGACLIVGWRGSRRALLLPLAFAGGLFLAVLPQWTLGGNILKTDLARQQSGTSDVVWRYGTNLSDCGPMPLVFSPLTDDVGEVLSGTLAVPDTISWRMTAVAAHLISGWDALPSPTYITSLRDGRWGLVTGLSGFFILGPVLAAAAAWQSRKGPRGEVVVLIGLLSLFAVSQAALAVTAAEFRFNLPGWVIAGTCLAFLTATGRWTRAHVGMWLAGGALVSLGVYFMGQMTLSYSPYWLACTR